MGGIKPKKPGDYCFLFPLLKARLLGKSMKKGEINTLSALQVVFVDKMVRLLGTLLSILVQDLFPFYIVL